jgi:hypothetical protein
MDFIAIILVAGLVILFVFAAWQMCKPKSRNR